MTLEDDIIWIIMLAILISILIMINSIRLKKYIFKMDDFTEIIISCVALGLAIGTCYVLLYYAINNKLLSESTSSLAIRLFALLGGFYLFIKAFESFIRKIIKLYG